MISRFITASLACAVPVSWSRIGSPTQASAGTACSRVDFHAIGDAFTGRRPVLAPTTHCGNPSKRSAAGKALDVLSNLTKVNVVGEWDQLNEMKVQRTTPVSVNLHDVTLLQALNEICQNLAEYSGRPQFFLADGIVKVTTPYSASNVRATAFIDIRPLLGEMRKEFNPEHVPPGA